MTNPPRFCQQCGTPLTPSARFCSKCGAVVQSIPLAPPPPVSAQTPTPVQPIPRTVYAPQPPEPIAPRQAGPAPYADAYEPPLDDFPPEIGGLQSPRRSNLRWLLIGGAAAVLVVCCLAGGLFYALGDISDATQTPTPTNTGQPTPTFTPTATSPVVVMDTPQPPPTSSPPRAELGSGQVDTPDRIVDDFSTDALGWVEVSGESGYVDGQYFMRAESNGDWVSVLVPMEEAPTHIEFDARVVDGLGNGYYSILCMYQDDGNHFIVGINPAQRRVWVQQVQNSYVSDLADYIDLPAFSGGVDRISIDCTVGGILVIVNNQIILDIMVSGQEGEMWLQVNTWSDAPGGMEVRFDNLEAWKQRQ